MKQTQSTSQQKQVITIGGGCFWCLEPLFDDLVGVEKVEVGYSGGSGINPTYQQVCTGTTGHAEVVQITFDPQVITLGEILQIFFTVHDPTTLNRQGADVGPQYRSIVLYRDDEQTETVEQVVREIEAAKIWDAPIVTQIVQLQAFYKAESYHQGYFDANPQAAYCQAVIAPKVVKFRKRFDVRLKSASKRDE
jgi:peptide-methionine (S)-S-oxide reductase